VIFLRSSIGKFGSSLARPVSWREGKMNFVGPSRNIIRFIHFLFVDDFFFIGGCRKHECFKIAKACSYCPLGLGIVGYSDKSLYIRPSLHMLTTSQYSPTHINASISLEELKTFCLRYMFNNNNRILSANNNLLGL